MLRKKNTDAVLIRAKLKKGDAVNVVLDGRCMEPLLKAGDIAKVVAAADIQRGDICLICGMDKRLRLHRIIEIDGKTVRSKGDRTGRFETVDMSSVLGRAEEVKINERPEIQRKLSQNKALTKFKAFLSEKSMNKKCRIAKGILIILNNFQRIKWRVL